MVSCTIFDTPPAASEPPLFTVVAIVSLTLVKSLLFGVTAYDPVTLAGAPLALVAVAALASAVPARRAPIRWWLSGRIRLFRCEIEN